MHRWARLWILGIGVLGACADAPRPDLRRLYSFDSVDSAQSPVIVIPGILGSRLRDAGGREIWPGSAYEVLFGSKDRLALTIDPQTLEPVADGVVADGLFDALLGRDFYGQLLQTLEGSGGYQRTRAGTPVDDARRRYYVFAYDWRQDNVVTARKLDALIEQIRRDPEWGFYVKAIDLTADLSKFRLYFTSVQRANAELQQRTAQLGHAAREQPARRGQANIVLGDLHGRSAASWLVAEAGRLAELEGWSVAFNKPYAGGFITEHFGHPWQIALFLVVFGPMLNWKRDEVRKTLESLQEILKLQKEARQTLFDAGYSEDEVAQMWGGTLQLSVGSWIAVICFFVGGIAVAMPPAIVISGEASMAETVEAIRLGVHDFIEKPLDLEYFRAQVNRAAERSALQRQNMEVPAGRAVVLPPVLVPVPPPTRRPNFTGQKIM